MAHQVDVHQETRNLDKYERGQGIEARLLARFRRRLEAEVTALSPSSLLDAGCGEGVVTAWLADALPGAQITGADGRDDALEDLRRRSPRVRAVHADLYDLPFADGEFDVVVSTEVLEHLERPRDAVRELARVARTHVVVTVPHEPFFRGGNLARGRYVGRLGSTPGHLNTWGRRGLVGLLRPEVESVRWFSVFPWQAAVAPVRA